MIVGWSTAVIFEVLRRAMMRDPDTGALNTSAQLWLNLQNSYDLAMAAREIGKQVEKIKPVVDVKAHAA
jgi:hypothetical protein